jgi:hypothetical protein
MSYTFARGKKLGLMLLMPVVMAASGCAVLDSFKFGGGGGAASGSTTATGPAANAPAQVIVQYRGGARSFEAQTANEKVGGRVVQTFDVIGGALVALPAGMSAQEGVALFKKQPGVVNAEPDTPARTH